jgi:hypothetical protein
MNKLKIVNDPVYGFIAIPSELAFDLIEHPYFQRLRRIRQLGLSHLVYPGAQHTRFSHALGAMHLMGEAIATLRAKGNPISAQHAEDATLAILLHDLGHGPYSHALEYSIIPGVTHEHIGYQLTAELNREFGGALEGAMALLEGRHELDFLHGLVAGQLDVDRLDYLSRDAYFTGVTEGTISWDRIIRMLEVDFEGKLAIAQKGLYSIEKFLMARRLMYWQVYLHKAVLAADMLLLKTLQRARFLAAAGEDLPCHLALSHFLTNDVTKADLTGPNSAALSWFAELDDTDIASAVKNWARHSDPILSTLAQRFIGRRLPRLILRAEEPSHGEVLRLQEATAKLYNVSLEDAHYFADFGSTENVTYSPAANGSIRILQRDGKSVDITLLSEVFSIASLQLPTTKHFLWGDKGLM